MVCWGDISAHIRHFWSLWNVYLGLTIHPVWQHQTGLLCWGNPQGRHLTSSGVTGCSPSLLHRGRKTHSHGKSRKTTLSLYSQRRTWNQGEVHDDINGEALSKSSQWVYTQLSSSCLEVQFDKLFETLIFWGKTTASRWFYFGHGWLAPRCSSSSSHFISGV